MSRVAKKPVVLPKGVECKVDGANISVKGPKGELKLPPMPDVQVTVEAGEIRVSAPSGDYRFAGTARALLAGMVKGVSEGYTKKLELVGVGYRAAMQGKDLSLSLGFSHPVLFAAPEGVTLATPTQTEITISGADPQRVGEAAAKIRALRPPEPYKGKGVRYAGEKITLKEAKKA
jgi:large subunit ribosomal protein L6